MTPHLALTDVSVSFNGFKAVSGLRLTVGKGELRCLIGPNGAGKTTALDLICGKTKADAGSITLDGRELSRLEEHEIARAGVGRKFQVPSVFRQLSVRDNLEVAMCRETGVLSTLMRRARTQEGDGLEALAEFVGLADVLDDPAANLSHGQTQWLEIALLLAQDSELILLDEPTAGMTHQETAKTADICQRLKGKHTIVVVEHDMGFVREIGDVISVMHQGALLAEGSVAEISADARVREVYLGTMGIAGA
ncbi:MAG: urea ABC transporter ATP-binding protein UrtD [Salinarimonas sp.]